LPGYTESVILFLKFDSRYFKTLRIIDYDLYQILSLALVLLNLTIMSLIARPTT
jgi:hypothetical protein